MVECSISSLKLHYEIFKIEQEEKILLEYDELNPDSIKYMNKQKKIKEFEEKENLQIITQLRFGIELTNSKDDINFFVENKTICLLFECGNVEMFTNYSQFVLMDTMETNCT